LESRIQGYQPDTAGREQDMRGHQQDMGTFEEFEKCLQDALTHLYDPGYRPPGPLWTVLGWDPQPGPEAFQLLLVQAIEDLKPTPNVPPTARSWRIYGLLAYRYVQDLSQAETAEHLGITSRHVRREQSEAVHVLAMRLWEQGTLRASATKDASQERKKQPPELSEADFHSQEWHSQVKQELESLQRSAPGTVAGVGDSIRGVVELESTLTSQRGISLHVEHVQPNLVVALHPTVLRQVLITTIGELAKLMSLGRITLRAERQQGKVRVSIMSHPIQTYNPPKLELVRELLATHCGSVRTVVEEDIVLLFLELPSVDQVVLVVDDNPDLIHLFQRYVTGTKYHITHIGEGQRVIESVEASVPDIIVLDVMLPDVDGWQLLAHLREHQLTRTTPIVVCSVVKEQELALALGATIFLPKPVQRQQFLQALDQALMQAATR
jgi:CheY-like chemotaxis protein